MWKRSVVSGRLWSRWGSGLHFASRAARSFGVGRTERPRYLIMDRDPLCTTNVRSLLRDAGVKVLRPPACSPNFNPFAERFVRSIQSECLAKVIQVDTCQHEHHVVCADRGLSAWDDHLAASQDLDDESPGRKGEIRESPADDG